MTNIQTIPKKVLPFFDEFILQLQAQQYSPKTIYNYSRDLSVFEIFLLHISKTSFAEVTKITLLEYKAYLSSEERRTTSGAKSAKNSLLSPISINRHISALRSYLKFLIDYDKPCPVPPDALKLVKTTKKHPHVAELHELVQIIESPTLLETDVRIKKRNRAMLEVLFSTGMRISELLNLNRDQIDNSGRLFITGKGRKERFVYLTPRAFTHLKQYTQIRTDKSPALFIPYSGRNNKDVRKRISPNYLQYKIKRYRVQLGINIPISAHSLRHGFATYIAEQGGNPAAIQVLLGHESLDTTTRYVHASDRYAEQVHTDFHPLKNKS